MPPLNILQFINRFASSMIDFIYPPVCLSCNKLLPDGYRKVCNDCWSAIPAITKDHPLYQETRTRLLSDGYISELVSCFVFEKEGPLQYIAHALKYQEYKSLGVEMGKQIGRLIQDWNVEADLIIPVPLHRIKYRERGYNQAELIASGIAAIIDKPVAIDIVQRTHYTQTQTMLNIQERQKNVEDAFKTVPGAPKKLQGKTCLLVDDVITTGATINSCAKRILAEGAASIIATSSALAK